jgi:hypothetical protein
MGLEKKEMSGLIFSTIKPTTTAAAAAAPTRLINSTEMSPPSPQAVVHNTHTQPVPRLPRPQIVSRPAPDDGRVGQSAEEADHVVEPCGQVVVGNAHLAQSAHGDF